MNERRRLARLAVVAALFAVLALPLRRVGPTESPAWSAARAHLPVDVAIVGDSRAHAGVSPTRLTAALAAAGLPDRKLHNFATDGTDALHHFDFVDRALLRAGPPPRVIVWAPNPLGFNDARTNNRLEQVAGVDLRAVWRAGAPREMLLDLVTLRLFPPYRARPILAGKIADKVEILGKKSLPLQTRLLGLRYEEPPRSREYHPLPDGHEPFTVLDWEDRFRRGVRGYELDYAGLGKMDWHMRIAGELLARAREAGVLVVVVELPVAPHFRAHQGLDPRHLAWRARLADLARLHGALYWDHTARFDDDRAFGDPAHMSDVTSFAYSTYLGDELARDPTVRAALTSSR